MSEHFAFTAPLDDQPRTDLTFNDIFVLMDDPHLLVVDKPAGLLTVPGRGPDKAFCLLSLLQTRYPALFLVHRLDMATSGLMVFAKTPETQRALNLSFAARQVHKTYQALVAGHMDLAKWPLGQPQAIDLPLIIDWPNRPRSKVDVADGKPSLTHWLPLAHTTHANQACTRVHLEPHTGRTHQLRVHMHALGHPILGDRLYAPANLAHASQRLLLHAHKLALLHPITGLPLSLTSTMPF